MEAGQYVQCIRHQSAECPIHIGGIYRIASVNSVGEFRFDRCGREHHPMFFRAVLGMEKPPTLFKEGDVIRLQPWVMHGDRPCPLTALVTYRAGSIDDLNRVFVHHEACDQWHSMEDFEVVPPAKPSGDLHYENLAKLAYETYRGELALRTLEKTPKIEALKAELERRGGWGALTYAQASAFETKIDNLQLGKPVKHRKWEALSPEERRAWLTAVQVVIGTVAAADLA
jgi:hypothetical protein